MPGLSGLDTLTKIKESNPTIPVIMITKNDTEVPRKWVNGTLGIIQSLSEDKIKILTLKRALSSYCISEDQSEDMTTLKYFIVLCLNKKT